MALAVFFHFLMDLHRTRKTQNPKTIKKRNRFLCMPPECRLLEKILAAAQPASSKPTTPAAAPASSKKQHKQETRGRGARPARQFDRWSEQCNTAVRYRVYRYRYYCCTVPAAAGILALLAFSFSQSNS